MKNLKKETRILNFINKRVGEKNLESQNKLYLIVLLSCDNIPEKKSFFLNLYYNKL